MVNVCLCLVIFPLGFFFNNALHLQHVVSFCSFMWKQRKTEHSSLSDFGYSVTKGNKHNTIYMS